MQQRVAQQKPLYIGWKHGRRAIYTMRPAADGWEVYRDGVLLKSGLASSLAALDCAHADEARRA
ncbi:MAG TPA: hypothetical protein VFT66_15780 [Roseiflexaceae bacterium]|nr:hypothetical protein [Roseiflexaceae bacterium]